MKYIYTLFFSFTISCLLAQSILITEFMADPTPSQGLPDAEFVELYNAGSTDVDLDGFMLSSGGSPQLLPPFLLAQGAYVIVCDDSDEMDFLAYGDVVTVSSFPALSNGGDNITVADSSGLFIHSIDYDLDWYGGVSNSGGFTIEMINPDLLCQGASNWSGTLSPTGGTPATQNSIFDNTPDTSAPGILSITATANNLIVIVFDEIMDMDIVDPDLFNITPNDAAQTIGDITEVILSPELNTVTIEIASPFFQSGEGYSINFNSAISDCVGNSIGIDIEGAFPFYMTVAATPFDILITEFMADETPAIGVLPVDEYIELYNRSMNAIELEGYEISSGSSPQVLSPYLLLPGEYVLICDDNVTEEFININVTNLIEVESLPGLSNTADNITLKDNNQVVIHSIDFTIDWYNDEDRDEGGWSIEMINPDWYCKGAINWMANQDDAVGGSPGIENSVYSEVPDEIAPSILSVEVDNANQITISFDENIDTGTLTASNFSIGGIGEATGITIVNEQQVIVVFGSSGFQSGNNYTVVANVADCIGNLGMSDFMFLYFATELAEPFDVLITEFMANPNDALLMPEVEYIEVYNRSNKIIDLSTLELNGSAIEYDVLMPNSYKLICNSEDDKQSFIDEVGIDTMDIAISSFTLSNSGSNITLKIQGGEVIHELDYGLSWYNDSSRDDGGWSIEMINLDWYCKGMVNWMACQNEITIGPGGTPAAQNSVFSNASDNASPTILQVSPNSNMQVTIVFDENLEASTLFTINFSINGIGNATNVAFGSDNNIVVATFGSPFQSESEYTLAVNDVADCLGNTGNSTFLFNYYETENPEPFDILITEFMANPNMEESPLLPTAEYIELYNRSDKIVNLESMDLVSGQEVTLGYHILLPGEYVVLCSDEFVEAFSPFGNVLGVGTLPVLSNSADFIELVDASSISIHKINYTLAWYNNPAKDDGGWSIEMVNPELYCYGSNNWRASNDDIGGTPATQNSVFDDTPDETPPMLVEAQAYRNNIVKLFFNEKLSQGVADISLYSINGVGSVNDAVLESDEQTVTISFDPAYFQSGETYTITIDMAFSDCLGNSLSANLSIEVTYYETEIPEQYDILINEIYADEKDPIGLPKTEYIELYNRSNKIINLESFRIFEDENDSDPLPFHILQPNSYVVLYQEDPSISFAGGTPKRQVSGMPSLPNEQGIIILRDSLSNIINATEYNSDLYFNPSGEAKGRSLELINPLNYCATTGNWRQSEHPTGGTPGKVNYEITPTSDDIFPDLIRAYPAAENAVFLYFSESLDIATASQTNFYSIDNSIGEPLAVVLLPPLYNTVLMTLAQPIDAGTIYTVTVDDVTDCQGNRVMLFNTASFSIPEPIEPSDIVLNEILFNPRTGGHRFVELYNRSSKVVAIDSLVLRNYKDFDVVNVPYLLFPDDYVVLTSSSFNIKSEYDVPNPYKFIEMGIPAFDNKEDTISIWSRQGILIDSLNYDDDFHNALLDDDDGVSLERIDPSAETSATSNWHSAAFSVGYATPTYLNSQYLAGIAAPADEIFSIPNTTFSPDDDSFEDFMQFNYQVDAVGYLATIKIFDAKGRLINTIANNEILAESGTFKWDGEGQDGEKGRIGIYIVVFELINPELGTSSVSKETIVLAAKL